MEKALTLNMEETDRDVPDDVPQLQLLDVYNDIYNRMDV